MPTVPSPLPFPHFSSGTGSTGSRVGVCLLMRNSLRESWGKCSEFWLLVTAQELHIIHHSPRNSFPLFWPWWSQFLSFYCPVAARGNCRKRKVSLVGTEGKSQGGLWMGGWRTLIFNLQLLQGLGHHCVLWVSLHGPHWCDEHRGWSVLISVPIT